jgi:hypothetical protein
MNTKIFLPAALGPEIYSALTAVNTISFFWELS